MTACFQAVTNPEGNDRRNRRVVDPMRVLHVGKFYPPFAGGMEYFLADLLAAQTKLGLPVAALVHDEGPGWQARTPPLGTPPPLIYRAPCLGRLLYAPLSPSFPYWLNRVIREFDPQLLHLHLPNTSAFAALALPRARRLPWVVHWHADVVASTIDRRLALAYQLYRPFEQRLLGHSQAIIATSPPYLDASLALRPWRERCEVIPLGLDPNRLPVPTNASLAWAEGAWGGQGPRVLTIGRLTYYKGHEVLIRALARLPRVRGLIVGRGEYQKRLQGLIEELALGDRVRLLGYQRADQLAALLATCDLFSLPSLERTEAFGLVLLEAMHFGKPILVSDIPGSGAPWVVAQATNGLRAPPGDAEALAHALSGMLANPARMRALGAAGAKALEHQYALGPIATAIQSLYQRLVPPANFDPLANP